ncbi:MAG: hypothetical protein WC227_01370 [Patescibacteria group bacterium]|jgi:hypothetical protein
MFDKATLFSPIPSPNAPYFVVLAISAVIVILMATAILLFIKNEWRRFAVKYVPPFMTFGVLGLIHLAARYEGLPWLASNIFFVSLLAIFSIWILVIAVWSLRAIPKFAKEQEANERYEKYLPKKKK